MIVKVTGPQRLVVPEKFTAFMKRAAIGPKRRWKQL